MWDALYALGRVAVPVMYVLAGFGKLMNPAGVTAMIAGKGLPMAQMLAVGTGVFELVAGLMLAIGFKTRWAALALFVFTAVATYLFHPFWMLEGAARMAQQTAALKNLTAMGALLMLAAAGPGRFSVDGRP